jgi:hypothetical protein
MAENIHAKSNSCELTLSKVLYYVQCLIFSKLCKSKDEYWVRKIYNTNLMIIEISDNYFTCKVSTIKEPDPILVGQKRRYLITTDN